MADRLFPRVTWSDVAAHAARRAEPAKSEIADQIDPIAAKLADANNVEQAWFLRGVADNFDGRPMEEGSGEAGVYRAQYRKGWIAASAV